MNAEINWVFVAVRFGVRNLVERIKNLEIFSREYSKKVKISQLLREKNETPQIWIGVHDSVG